MQINFVDSFEQVAILVIVPKVTGKLRMYMVSGYYLEVCYAHSHN